MILIIARETLLIAAHTDMEIVFASIVAMRRSFVMAINGNIINVLIGLYMIGTPNRI